MHTVAPADGTVDLAPGTVRPVPGSGLGVLRSDTDHNAADASSPTPEARSVKKVRSAYSPFLPMLKDLTGRK